MEKNKVKVEQLMLQDPNTIGEQVGAWFEEKAKKGEPVDQVISVSFFLTQAAPKTIAMHSQQQMPVFIFNFVIVYTEKPAA